MTARPKLESSEFSDLNRVISWYITLRWIASVGVLGVIAVARFFVTRVRVSDDLWLLVAILFLCNGAFYYYHKRIKKQNLSRQEMESFFHAQVCADYILLFLMVFRTGFLENPFVYYFVFHIMLTSFLFSSRIVYGYVATLVVLFCLVTAGQYAGWIPLYHLGIAHDEFVCYGRMPMLLVALVSTLMIVAYLIESIKTRIEERGRGVEVELARYRSLDRVKSNFILQVTHELRGPVAALKGYHEMMLKGITGPIQDQTRKALCKADIRTRNLLNIIDEMIDYAYMKSGENAEFPTAPISLSAILEHNRELYRVQAGQRSIGINAVCPPDIKVRASEDLMNIIVSNLVTNAIKYSRDGSEIHLSVTLEDDMAHLQVKDQGIGIAPEELELVFEEFYRTRRAREIERDGTGLGLSIVKKVVDSLGGRISVYSEIDRGSNFHVFLPTAK